VQTGTLDPVADPRWTALLDRSPGALVFHHPAWLALLRDQYRYQLSAWCVFDGDEVVAGLPVARVRSRLTGTRLVAVPFCDLCGPLAATGAPEESGQLLRAAIFAERREAGLDLEIHEEVGGLPGAQPSQQFLQHAVPLAEDPAEVEARFTKSHVKRGARKAERAGLRAQRRVDQDALDAFYSLHLATRRRQGVPIQPKRFIRSLTRLFEAGMGFVSLVGREGEAPAAAAVFLAYNGTLTYKYGASDRTRLSERPNNMLFLEAIRWACAQRLHTLDMGRTDLDNDGLRQFKLAWGASERELSYTLLSDRPHARADRGVPPLVRGVLRRSPAFVSRLVGESLYRHFA
jgi:CelD/BcsL family acetyltransferase involved in cellulose biosynthesis